MKRKNSVGGLSLVFMLALLLGAGCSQGFYVTNKSGEEVKDLKVHSEQFGTVTVDRELDLLKPGERKFFGTPAEVQHIQLEFTLKGKVHTNSFSPDFWAGEKYYLDIQPDGKVEGEYRKPGS